MIKKLFFLGIFSLAISLNAQIGADKVIIVQDVNAGSGNVNPSIKWVSGGLMYISLDEQSGTGTPGGADLGRELWVSDGTTVTFVKDLRTGSANSFPDNFFELNNKIYFGASTLTSNSAAELHVTDGTAGGTALVDLFPLVDSESISSNVVVANKVYLQAKPETGADFALVEWDGVNPATRVPNADPAMGVEAVISSEVLIEMNGKIYMEMSYSTDGLGDEVYEYDPATDRFTVVKDINTNLGSGSAIAHLVKLGSEIYFEATNGSDPSSLYKTDGTEAGTVKIASAASVSGLAALYAWDGKIFMEGDDGNGDNLWVYDPALDTMTNLTNFTAGDAHDPADYVPGGDGYLYYRGELDSSTLGYLFRTDGTTVEPVNIQVKDVDDLALLNGKLYFEGDFDNSGNEVFTLDLATLSTSTFGFNDKISIYPNPTKNTINVLHSLSTDLKYEVFDIAGRSVIQGELLNKTINHNLNSGIYILKLSDNADSFTQKIVVK